MNEFIPEPDIRRYGITALNEKYAWGETDWTVDRARDIYLRRVGGGGPEDPSVSRWNLYWRGDLIEFKTITLEADGKRGGPVRVRKRLESLRIPQALLEQREEILSVIRDALVAYKDGGVYATATDYSLELDV